MKKKLAILWCAAMMLPVIVRGDETKTIKLMQDDGQDRMATKVYELQHVKANDIGSYVQAAALRKNKNSKVRMVNYEDGKKQALIVSTSECLLPIMDELIATMDRGEKADQYGYMIDGAGYAWEVYWSQFREPEDFLYLADIVGTDNTNIYTRNGTLWMRDYRHDLDYLMAWVKYLDRPTPQVKLTLSYYLIRESTLRDLGIDYLAWKNGPGLDLFSVAYSSGHIAWDRLANLAAMAMGWGYGGFATAPAFDMSFIRLLQQSGDAEITATATLNLANNQSTSASITIAPVYNRITKGLDHQSAVEAFPFADIEVSIASHPIICIFANQEDRMKKYGWIRNSPELYQRNRGSLIFSYRIYSKDATEANNLGDQVGSAFQYYSEQKIVDLGVEQLLAQGSREYDVEQTTGVPFLCNLPVLKYIFGTTTTMKERIHAFITVKADLVQPDLTARNDISAKH